MKTVQEFFDLLKRWTKALEQVSASSTMSIETRPGSAAMSRPELIEINQAWAEVDHELATTAEELGIPHDALMAWKATTRDEERLCPPCNRPNTPYQQMCRHCQPKVQRRQLAVDTMLRYVRAQGLNQNAITILKNWAFWVRQVEGTQTMTIRRERGLDLVVAETELLSLPAGSNHELDNWQRAMQDKLCAECVTCANRAEMCGECAEKATRLDQAQTALLHLADTIVSAKIA